MYSIYNPSESSINSRQLPRSTTKNIWVSFALDRSFAYFLVKDSLSSHVEQHRKGSAFHHTLGAVRCGAHNNWKIAGCVANGARGWKFDCGLPVVGAGHIHNPNLASHNHPVNDSRSLGKWETENGVHGRRGAGGSVCEGQRELPSCHSSNHAAA